MGAQGEPAAPAGLADPGDQIRPARLELPDLGREAGRPQVGLEDAGGPQLVARRVDAGRGDQLGEQFQQLGPLACLHSRSLRSHFSTRYFLAQPPPRQDVRSSGVTAMSRRGRRSVRSA
ncbi:hypothetical protein GCM10017673_04550 [Streptosporangium violaceochromogenes]|nr:hypothetical protein GCM10017673_04550 [Streptosporangium violaceochromogenes]